MKKLLLLLILAAGTTGCSATSPDIFRKADRAMRGAQVLIDEAADTAVNAREDYRRARGAVTDGVLDAPFENFYPSDCEMRYYSRGARHFTVITAGGVNSEAKIPEDHVTAESQLEYSAVCAGVYVHYGRLSYDYRDGWSFRNRGGRVEGRVIRLFPGEHDEELPAPVSVFSRSVDRTSGPTVVIQRESAGSRACRAIPDRNRRDACSRANR